MIFQFYVYVALSGVWFVAMFMPVLSYFLVVMVFTLFLPVEVALLALCLYGWLIVDPGFVQFILPQREVGHYLSL